MEEVSLSLGNIMFKISQFNDWNEVTWNEMVVTSHLGKTLSPASIEKFHDILKHCRANPNDYDSVIRHSLVSGNISEGWDQNRFENVKCPSFQKSLDHVMTTYDDWNPADYAIHYLVACSKGKLSPVNLFPLGRALRNIPSFLREYILHNKLTALGYDSTIPSVAMNMQSHVDLIINYDDKVFCIWSYNNTSRARSRLPTKSKKRGRIHDGLNILAPIYIDRTSPENDIICDWFTPSTHFVNLVSQVLISTPVPYSSNNMDDPDYYENMVVFDK